MLLTLFVSKFDVCEKVISIPNEAQKCTLIKKNLETNLLTRPCTTPFLPQSWMFGGLPHEKGSLPSFNIFPWYHFMFHNYWFVNSPDLLKSES